ncbi:MAG: ketoacyl-ACP synthase III [Cytophagaceae bacterium]|nr:ketoacyl-ACP synthase III [Cytophagaceae bacterium]
MGVSIKAIEYYLPKGVLTNSELQSEFPDYDFQKFEKKVGIFERHVSEINQTALDLAKLACDKLFERFDKDKIDFILYCTQSPEYILPTTACILQDRLGLRKNIGALDFNLGCSGYPYGLSLAKSLIEGDMANQILLVTADTYTKYLHQSDRTNRSIFGDAATATLIVKDFEKGIGDFIFGTDGSGYEKLIIKRSGSKSIAFSPENSVFKENDEYLYMDGPEVFNFTINVVPDSVEQILRKNEINKIEVNQFIFHQANSFMLNHLRKMIEVENDNFFNDLRFEGNTVSSTIPIALKKYSNNSNLSFPQNILILGFGVGLSWSGGLIKISNNL